MAEFEAKEIPTPPFTSSRGRATSPTSRSPKRSTRSSPTGSESQRSLSRSGRRTDSSPSLIDDSTRQWRRAVARPIGQRTGVIPGHSQTSNTPPYLHPPVTVRVRRGAAARATCWSAGTRSNLVVGGLVFGGLQPQWIWSRYDERLHPVHPPSPRQANQAWQAHPDAADALIVSPTPSGTCADIKATAGICHRRGKPLIVDEAWGAHLPIHQDQPTWAMDVGADVCVVSVRTHFGRRRREYSRAQPRRASTSAKSWRANMQPGSMRSYWPLRTVGDS